MNIRAAIYFQNRARGAQEDAMYYLGYAIRDPSDKESRVSASMFQQSHRQLSKMARNAMGLTDADQNYS